MKHLVPLTAFLIYIVMLNGCAGYKILPISKNVNESKPQEGLRFYRPQPYLLISEASPTSPAASASANKDASTSAPNKTAAGFTYQIIYLPDYTNGYILQRVPGMGTVDASAKLIEGWMLTELGVKTDSQIPQTLEAISKLIPTLLPTPAKDNKNGSNIPTNIIPGLYQIKFDQNNNTPTLIYIHN